jgi:hypothetical protein
MFRRILEFFKSSFLTIILISLLILQAFFVIYDRPIINNIYNRFNTPKPLMIGMNVIKIPLAVGLVYRNYYDNSDSINTAYFMSNNTNFIAVSGLNLSKINIGNFITDLSARYENRYDTSRYREYVLDICGDTVWGYHLVVFKLRNSHNPDTMRSSLTEFRSERLIIPKRKLYFEVSGKNLSLEEAIDFIKKMVYFDNRSFYWKSIK